MFGGFAIVHHLNGDPEGRDATQSSPTRPPLRHHAVLTTLGTFQHFVSCFPTFFTSAQQPPWYTSLATPSRPNDDRQHHQKRQAGASRRSLQHYVVVAPITSLQQPVRVLQPRLQPPPSRTPTKTPLERRVFIGSSQKLKDSLFR